MIEVFTELLDQIFWEGYTEQLAKENPQAFNIEYNDFLNNYS